jgi:hypothetical protein
VIYRLFEHQPPINPWVWEFKTGSVYGFRLYFISVCRTGEPENYEQNILDNASESLAGGFSEAPVREGDIFRCYSYYG